MKPLSRGEFLKASGAGLAGAALLGVAGCGRGEQGGATELNFFASTDTTGTAEKLVKKFNEQNRGKYRVTYQEGSADTGQRFDQIRTQFEAGGEGVDVVLGDVVWTAQFAEQGWILDLSRRFPENARRKFLPGSIEAVTYKDKIWGAPWFTDTGLLYYRKDLLERSGFSRPPKTWSELKQMALTVKVDSGIESGFVFQGAQYEGGVCNGCEFIWTHGGEVLDPRNPNRVLVGEPDSVAGLTTERGLIESGVSPQAVTIYKEDESAGVFLDGEAVFMRNWPYVYAMLSDPEASRIRPGQVGVAELPSADGRPGNGTVGDQPFYIGSASEYPEAAWKFIEFMTAPEQQKFRAVEGSYLPTRAALYDDPEVQKSTPIVPLAREALQHTRPRPVSPYYSDMSLEMAEHFNASLNGDVVPQQAAQELQLQLEDFIAEGREAR